MLGGPNESIPTKRPDSIIDTGTRLRDLIFRGARLTFLIATHAGASLSTSAAHYTDVVIHLDRSPRDAEIDASTRTCERGVTRDARR